MATQIRVMNWNACGIRKNKNELEYFIKQHKIDVAIVVETLLSRDIKFVLRGFNTYRSHGPVGREGGLGRKTKIIYHTDR